MGLLRGRVRGRPPSANGASSFHLRWLLAGPFREAAVTFEVLAPPVVDRLYFWALQADFTDDAGARGGGAHLGLQWHPGHPGARAVNWGGYGGDGAELQGSPSPLPSTTGNPNTRDLRWAEGTPYRLVIAPAPEQDQSPPGVARAWRATVTELAAGTSAVVRDLYAMGDRISSVTMWSEVFARCDDPAVVVRWSDPAALDPERGWVVPEGLSVNYQSHAAGGCANTDSSVDGDGVVQRTGVPRRTAQGAVLRTR